MMKRLGFVGSGAITSAIVTGLCSEGGAAYEICLSPRNAEVAAELASRFEKVRVAASNQAVLDESEIVVIAVRPQIAEAVLADLRFRPDHHVISLVAGYPVQRMTPLVTPAAVVSRAVPLPMSARRRCPTAVYPRDPVAMELFNLLGQAFAVETDDVLAAFSTATSTMAAYFAYADCIAGWMTNNGVAPQQARDYVAQIFAGMAMTAVEGPDRTFPALAEDHATRGGLNEQVLRDLRSHHVCESITEALDSVMRRVTAASRQAL
ncbi:MAG TPA: pyrroline-5-carboxylate reductase [Candidatus Limnocylindrales bacterium]|nr:pyrroline-5-carboxylate reductase [Candidatus Limnocylindrales bacterium]